MTEVIVFLVVGSVAIVSAALMLLSENAVHSALFLVLNFICVAFFFLTLSAPFIALVQVAVYAGAIMVLFLFVIMLLGAEQVAHSSGPYTWLPRAAIVLALIFLITAGLALSSGEINSQAPVPQVPQVRVVHAADAPPVDVYFNDQLMLEDVDFRNATDYMSLAAGQYGVKMLPAGADPATESSAFLGDLQLSEGDTVSLVALGADGKYELALLQDDLSTQPDDKVRVTLLNGLPDAGAVDLVDPGLASRADDSRVLIANASFGEPVETVLLDPSDNLIFDVLPAGNLEADAIVSFDRISLNANTQILLVPAPEQLADGSTRILGLQVEAKTLPLFGSPQYVGGELFTTYLLPFEMLSILLLVAMMGAIVLTHRELQKEARPRRRVVRRPLVGPQSAAALASEAAEKE